MDRRLKFKKYQICVIMDSDRETEEPREIGAGQISFRLESNPEESLFATETSFEICCRIFQVLFEPLEVTDGDIIDKGNNTAAIRIVHQSNFFKFIRSSEIKIFIYHS
tara:strand:- start:852 stop:1175 length:324 start_codon:yes stop_codon:yes gene_type:complete